MNENTNKQELTLLSLNIERDKHTDKVLRLVTERMPDIFCLEEVQKPFAEELAHALGYKHLFSLSRYNSSRTEGAEPIAQGIMIAWSPRCSLLDTSVHKYNEQSPHPLKKGPNDANRELLVATIKAEDRIFRFGVTHFTWTPDGSASLEQRADMERMLLSLKEYHDDTGIVFCGDFNAPRGGEIFAMMSEQYTDNLPPHITTTLDQALHRAPLQERSALAVDSIFSTKEYIVSDVLVIDGVSDHVALFAKVSKNVC